MSNSNGGVFTARQGRQGHCCRRLCCCRVCWAQCVGLIANGGQGGNEEQFIVGSVLSVSQVPRLLAVMMLGGAHAAWW